MKKLSILLIVLFTAGCSNKQPIVIDTVTPAAQIEKELDMDVEMIAKEVSELREEMNRGTARTEAMKKAERGKLNPDSNSVLAKRVDLFWQGEVDLVLEKIAKDIGYKFTKKGVTKGFNPIVMVDAKQLRYIDILEELGWQLSPYGHGLIVKEKVKVLQLYK